MQYEDSVTVVPDDRMIIVGGKGLFFAFSAPENLHALQWQGGKGHLEFTDKPNLELDEAAYEHEVEPWVKLWQAERDRLAEEAAAAEAARLEQYNSEEARFERLRAERDRRIAETDYLIMPDYPVGDEKKASLLAYRAALRDLPAKDGAPWDGGGEETPWPANPLAALTRN